MLKRVRGYEPRGREFESLRVRYEIKHLRPTIEQHATPIKSNPPNQNTKSVVMRSISAYLTYLIEFSNNKNI